MMANMAVTTIASVCDAVRKRWVTTGPIMPSSSGTAVTTPNGIHIDLTIVVCSSDVTIAANAAIFGAEPSVNHSAIGRAVNCADPRKARISRSVTLRRVILRSIRRKRTRPASSISA